MNWQRLQFIFDRKLSATNFLEKALQRFGDFEFVRFDEPQQLDRSYASMRVSELISSINRVSNALRDVGLARFDRVAIYKANAPDYFCYGFGAIRAGGIAVPINGGMATHTLIEYLNYTGARILITDAARYQALIQADILRRCPQLRQILTSDAACAGALHFSPLLQQASASFTPVQPLADEDILIVHTSGTTGTPKGVLHTSGSFAAGLKGMLKIGPVFKDQRFMSVMPFNHYIAFQGIATSLIGGNAGLLVQHAHAPALLNHIESFRPAIVFCFPHCYVDMYDLGLRGRDLSSVKLWLAGADSSHEAHIREFVAHGSLFKLFGKTILPSAYIDTLGTSEVGFPAFFNASTRYTKRFSRCIGKRTYAGPKVMIADENGQPVAPLTIGRFMVKGETLFKGYWNAHDRLHGVVKNGWWWTGDVGYRDRSGRYFHLDRDIDVVWTTQGPVSSLLLEEHILNHEAVVEAVVIAQPVDDKTQNPFAYVQLKEGRQIEPETLQRWIETAIPSGVKCAGVRFVARGEIPRGLTGKVLKRELRQRLAAQG